MTTTAKIEELQKSVNLPNHELTDIIEKNRRNRYETADGTECVKTEKYQI